MKPLQCTIENKNGIYEYNFIDECTFIDDISIVRIVTASEIKNDNNSLEKIVKTIFINGVDIKYNDYHAANCFPPHVIDIPVKESTNIHDVVFDLIEGSKIDVVFYPKKLTERIC